MRTLNDVELNTVAGGGLLNGGALQATRSVLTRDSALDLADKPLAEGKQPAEHGPLDPIFPDQPPAGPCGQDRVCQFFQ